MTLSQESEPATVLPPHPAADNGRRRWFMRSIITATIVLFVLMVSILFWKWMTVKEPNSMVVIHGGKHLAGATVKAEAIFLPRPYEIPLNENGTGRFFPQPGRYRLHVMYGEHEVFFKWPIEIDVEAEKPFAIGLDPAVATTRPHLRTP